MNATCVAKPVGLLSVLLVVVVLLPAPAAGEKNGPGARVIAGRPVYHPGLVVAGPFAHKNLAIYILRPDADHRLLAAGEPAYITLAEGIKSGLVVITEDPKARVRRLLVTNKSNKRLFLQAGELIRGGKQDRTLQTSLVIPPKTVDAPVPSFCVEQGRWSGGKRFAPTGFLVPNRGVRVAIQSGSQERVWSGVGKYKSRAQAAMRRAGASPGRSKTSSVNEELADGKFGKLIEEYVAALKDVAGKFDFPVGMAYAVDGRISTVEIYHTTGLFRKLLPTLLRSAAAEAAASYDRRKRVVHPSSTDVSNFVAGAWDGKTRKERLGLGNVYVRIFGSRTLVGQLFYKDALIHSQILRKDAGPKPPKPIPQRLPRLPRLPRR